MFPKSQQGFTLVTAIFLLVVLAGLGAFMTTISLNQQIGSTLDFMGAKAFQAARSGTEWGLYKVLNTPPSCISSTDIGVINDMRVTMTCSVIAPTVNITEAGIGVIYSITATACNIPDSDTCPGVVSNPDYVERRFTVLADTTQ
ncbi:MAG: MSHA biogenesis protein MshP [Paraglaciecola sp.]|jgi:MSHA biogenesis protein MshP|uniref:hypothetical protein n=1 Tax=uncultured Paraglaciecola sp. TaxID=1765024 RepID=UPI0025FC80D7|nr:hypothetical protein [uncultured Paraglaciecola sp.]